MIKNSFFWDLFGKLSVHIVSFIVSVVLARLLTPAEFGTVGLVMVYITIAQVYMDMGFGAAIIQKKQVSNSLYNSFYTFNISVGIILFLALFLLANTIANFYNNLEMLAIARVLSIYFIIGSLSIAHKNMFIKNMWFKKISFINTISSMLSGVIGLVLAYLNFGVWALVLMSLSYKSIELIQYMVMNKHSFKFEMNLKEIRGISSFGSYHLANRIIGTFFDQLDALTIGKLFNPSTLGQYTRAKTFRGQFIEYSSNGLISVLFPSFSHYQHQKEKVEELFYRGLLVSSVVSLYLSGVLFLISKELFVVLFTEKWLYSSFIFKLLTITLFTHAISAMCVSLLLGLGYASTNLKLGIIKRLINVIPLFFLFQGKLEIFLYASLITSFINVLINFIFIDKVFQYSLWKNFKIIMVPLIITAVIVILISLTKTLLEFSISHIYSIIIQVICFSIPFLLFNLISSKKLRIEFYGLYKYALNIFFK